MTLQKFISEFPRHLPLKALMPFFVGSMLTACAPITPPPSLPSPVSIPSMPSSSSSSSGMPSLPSPNGPNAQPSLPAMPSGAPPSGNQDSASVPRSQNPDFPKNINGDRTSGSDELGVFDPLAGEGNTEDEKDEDSQELSWEKTQPSSSSAWELSLIHI